jgi:transposase
MAKPILSDELWKVIEPLLPAEPEKPKGERPRVPYRAALTGIIFVLKTGLPWEYLAPEMGCGSGITCWRRLRDWQKAGVWEKLHEVLLGKLGDAGKIHWSRVAVDSASIAAKKGASVPGRTPQIRANRA